MKKSIFHRKMKAPDFKTLYDEVAVKLRSGEEGARLRQEQKMTQLELAENLDSDEAFSVSAEWKEEIHRRCREIDEGQVNLIPAEKGFADLNMELK